MNKEKLERVKDALRSKGVRAMQEKNKTSRSDILQRELLRGQEEAYWDAIMIIEKEFGL